MSTRATYRFLSTNQFRGIITFYIHHDGYPEGAAYYFYDMMACENRRGGYADMFHRGNPNSEFTGGHDSHGDTEFKYDVEGDTLKAYQMVDWDKRKVGQGWRCFFTGTIVDFIKQYFPEHDLVEYNYPYGLKTVELPLKIARAEALNQYSYVDRWVDNGYSGNLSGSVSACMKNLHLFTDAEKFRLEQARVICQKALPHMKEYETPIDTGDLVLLTPVEPIEKKD